MIVTADSNRKVRNLQTINSLTANLDVAFGTSGVRGLVKDLTPEICFAFTKAFLQVNNSESKYIALSIDLRPSSSDIAKSCIAAIYAHGCKVIYCGELPTPALAFYSMSNSIPSIMITGSHIPFSRNGMKFYNADGEISKLDEINIISAEIELPENLNEVVNNVQIPKIKTKALECFKKRYTDVFPAEMLKGKRIGIYEHSSVARDVLKDLMSYFGADVISLERTDFFVPIDTEAVSEEDKEKAVQWSKKYNLDAIVSTDGDGDRPLISDENGQWLRGDVLGVICVNYLNATHVAAPVNVNSILEKSNDKLELTCSRTRIGSPYVIEAMNDLAKKHPSGKVVGYEANGGFMVGSDIDVNGKKLHSLPTRDAILPMLIVLSLSNENSLPISQLVGKLPSRFTASGCVKNILLEVSNKIISSLEFDKIKQEEFLFEIFADTSLKIVSINKTDGLRLYINNGDIIHIRASGNAPELRAYVETSTMKKSVSLVELVLMTLKNLPRQ